MKTAPRAPDISLTADFVAGRLRRNSRAAWQDARPRDWTLLATLAGSGGLAVDGHDIPLPAGALALVAPKRERRFHCSGPWQLLWFHFLMPDDAAAALSWPVAAEGVFRLATGGRGRAFRRIRDALQEAVELEALRCPGWYPLARSLVEGVVWRGNVLGAAEGPRDDARLARVRTQLRDYRDRRSIDAVAADNGFSRSALYAHFKRAVGMSPRRYREMHALRRAQSLLEHTRLSLAEIADQVNLPGAYYLSARFRKCLGIPPSAYRRQARSAQPGGGDF